MTHPRGALPLWGPVAAWCGLIFLFSGIPDLSSGLTYDFTLRKLAHMTEFGILYVLVRRARPKGPGLALAFCFLYAMSDEWHQSFVPGRSGRWLDVAIDWTGASVCAAAEAFFRRRY